MENSKGFLFFLLAFCPFGCYFFFLEFSHFPGSGTLKNGFGVAVS